MIVELIRKDRAILNLDDKKYLRTILRQIKRIIVICAADAKQISYKEAKNCAESEFVDFLLSLTSFDLSTIPDLPDVVSFITSNRYQTDRLKLRAFYLKKNPDVFYKALPKTLGFIRGCEKKSNEGLQIKRFSEGYIELLFEVCIYFHLNGDDLHKVNMKGAYSYIIHLMQYADLKTLKPMEDLFNSLQPF